MNGLVLFLYICENVQRRESKCTIPKRISSTFMYSDLLCNSFSVMSSEASFIVWTHLISLLTRYPRGYFMSKCQDTR